MNVTGHMKGPMQTVRLHVVCAHESPCVHVSSHATVFPSDFVGVFHFLLVSVPLSSCVCVCVCVCVYVHILCQRFASEGTEGNQSSCYGSDSVRWHGRVRCHPEEVEEGRPGRHPLKPRPTTTRFSLCPEFDRLCYGERLRGVSKRPDLQLPVTPVARER